MYFFNLYVIISLKVEVKKVKEQKGKNIIIGALLCIIILLTVSIILLLTNNNNISTTKIASSEETQSYTYENIEGLYTYEENIIVDNQKLKERTDLLLNADGTYFYSRAVRVSLRHAGNYIIDGNKIILNRLFTISDGPQLVPYFEKITLTINEDKTIKYNIKETEDEYIKNETLAKNTDDEKENFIKAYDADKENLLNNSYYFNKKNEKQ